MKRFFTVLTLSILVCFIPISETMAQGKKSEQKIKIIVADGSGTKVIIDTLITDGNLKDSIKVKDGKMIFIGDAGDDTFMKQGDRSGNVYVYTSSDNKGQKKDVKTITILSSDSARWTDKAESSDDLTRSIIAKDGIVVTVEGKDEEKVKLLAKEIQQKMGIKNQLPNP